MSFDYEKVFKALKTNYSWEDNIHNYEKIYEEVKRE